MVLHLNVHPNPILKLEPKVTVLIQLVLGVPISEIVFNLHFGSKSLLLFINSEGKVILDNHRVTVSSLADVVFVDFDNAVV